MLVGTHALMPVCACMVGENLAIKVGLGQIFPPRSMWVIGLFGILPDLCLPHINLEDRQMSWSHTVWFMVGLIVVVAMIGSFFEKGCRWRVALACWVAAALHLAADAISGGISWLYPWRDEVIGRYYIPAQQWMWYDAFFILFAWFLIRVQPYLEGRAIREASLPDNPES